MFLTDSGGDDALENHTLLEEGLAQCAAAISRGAIQATRASGTSAVVDGPVGGAGTASGADSSWDCTSRPPTGAMRASGGAGQRQPTGATVASGGPGQSILQSLQTFFSPSSIYSHSNRSMSG